MRFKTFLIAFIMLLSCPTWANQVPTSTCRQVFEKFTTPSVYSAGLHSAMTFGGIAWSKNNISNVILGYEYYPIPEGLIFFSILYATFVVANGATIAQTQSLVEIDQVGNRIDKLDTKVENLEQGNKLD